MPETEVSFSGRDFSAAELALVRETVHDFSSLSLTELSKTLCELLEWKRPTGKLKYEECRAFLEHLRAQGILALPTLRDTRAPGPRRVVSTSQSDAQYSVTGSAGDFEPITLHLVQASNRDLSSLFKQYVDRYHYLRYRIPFGAHLRYLVQSQKLPGRYLACLQFSSPAWMMAPRDAWIGWSSDERKRNLQFIVNQSRFLILPWVKVKGLASKILSLAARRLPQDWQTMYGYRPLLLETLVDRSRFSGTCYRAGNWIHLGATQGRGRMNRDHAAQGQSIKDIFVYPLCRHAREQLRTAVSPTFIEHDDEEAML
jgi:Druantia protein DruA